MILVSPPVAQGPTSPPQGEQLVVMQLKHLYTPLLTLALGLLAAAAAAAAELAAAAGARRRRRRQRTRRRRYGSREGRVAKNCRREQCALTFPLTTLFPLVRTYQRYIK